VRNETPLLDLGSVHPEWRLALAPVIPKLEELSRFLDDEAKAGTGFLPATHNILRVFRSSPREVKVLLVGQDPYPSPGHAIGLAFSVDSAVRPLPRSLRNMYRELTEDLGIPAAEHGDLSAWSENGVMLLNRTLTVAPGLAGSHRGRGWEDVTELAVRVLAARQQPLVAILWGADARKLAPLLEGVPVFESAHPSPLSASRGFFGSAPFSKANAALLAAGAEPVDWRVDREEGR
jgi:uracil-DNA glycosylase